MVVVDEADQIKAYLNTVSQDERQARIAGGLPPDHVLDMGDFPFRFMGHRLAKAEAFVEELAKRPTMQPYVLLFAAMLFLARKDFGQANSIMEAYQRLVPNMGPASMRFGHAPSMSHPTLPPVNGEVPKTHSVFLACDEAYFRFAVPFLRSLAKYNPGARAHVHVFGDGNFDRDIALDLTVSREDPEAFIAEHKLRPGHYYNSVRLVRFADALERAGGPLLIADVDGLVTGDISALWQRKQAVSLRVRGGRLVPWEQFSACIVVARTEARDYLKRVGDILRSDMTRAWWGLDQYALFSAWLGVHPTLGLIGPDIASVDENIPGLFWFTAGTNKFNFDRVSPFCDALRHYGAAGV